MVNSSKKETSSNTERDENELNQIKRKTEGIQVQSVIPKHREDNLNWEGWGYKDTYFKTFKDDEGFKAILTGNRYPISGLNLPNVEKWVKDLFKINIFDPKYSNSLRQMPSEGEIPKSNINQQDLDEIKKLGLSYSLRGADRLWRARDQTLRSMYILKTGMFKRVPDIVIWPSCHQEVEKIVKLADKLNMVILVYGGGTAVSGATQCPENESRIIISLDTTQMNRILWVDVENLVACAESGIVGQDLERELGKLGYTTGHEPDSYEFSTLGGWVATRASGMKRNVYGNIEDLLVHVRMMTPKGVLEKNCQVPRLSSGPDFNHLILGSEGSLGVITEVIFKIRPLPKYRRYGSLIFPNFETGFHTMRDIARRRCQPASIRLMDNEQFKFGLILRPQSGYLSNLVDILKKIYVGKFKGFDFDKLCVITLLFEGEEKEVKDQEKVVYAIASKYGGLPAGEKNGERGYMLTFAIAYLRDLAMKYSIVCESFETSVPWDRALSLCKNVRHHLTTECKKYSIANKLISLRVTQTYDAGCVIYFYFAFEGSQMENPLEIYERLEESARDVILANGGSISHHHGVGKLRKKWYRDTVSDVGVGLFRAAKNELDPNNIFATNNFIKSKL